LRNAVASSISEGPRFFARARLSELNLGRRDERAVQETIPNEPTTDTD
jgi:hypothetical protein